MALGASDALRFPKMWSSNLSSDHGADPVLILRVFSHQLPPFLCAVSLSEDDAARSAVIVVYGEIIDKRNLTMIGICPGTKFQDYPVSELLSHELDFSANQEFL